MYYEIQDIVARIEHGSLSGDKQILIALEKALYNEDYIGGMDMSPTATKVLFGVYTGAMMLAGILIGVLIN